MPIYSYSCLQCEFQFEEYQSIKDDPLQICPNCNGQLKKNICSSINLNIKQKYTFVRVKKNQTVGEAYKKGQFIDDKTRQRYIQNESTNGKRKDIYIDNSNFYKNFKIKPKNKKANKEKK